MAKKKKGDCSELAESIALMAFDIADLKANPTLQNVTDEMRQILPDEAASSITRQVVSDSIFEFTEQFRRDTAKSVIKGSAIVKREAGTDQKLIEQIEALERGIDQGLFEQTPKRIRQRISKEIAQLRKRAGALGKERSLTQSLEKSITKLERQISGKEVLTSKARVARPDIESIASLRDIRDPLSKQVARKKADIRTIKGMVSRIEALDKALKSGSFVKRPELEKRRISKAVEAVKNLQSRLSRESDLKSSIDSLINQLKGVEPFAVGKTRVKRFQDDPDIRDLEFKEHTLKKQVREQIRSLKKLSPQEKALEALNISRTMLLSFDLSALRQGGKLSLANPELLLRNFTPMLRAFVSEKFANQINEEILTQPDAWMFDRGKLELSALDGGLTRGEEEYARQTGFLDKIPLIGAGVKASERSFVTFVNLVRSQAFLKFARTVRNGSPTHEEMLMIGNAVNILTGKGDLGRFQQSGPLLASIMLAPRYTLSQFQTLTLNPIRKAKASPEVRNLIIKQYVRMLSSFSLLSALMLMAGFEIEEDPTSTDFLKFRKGRTRIDMGTGLLQPIVLMSRIAKGQVKSPVTGKVRPLRFDTISGFARSKFSPLLSMAIDIGVGKSIIGEKVTVNTVDGIMDLARNQLMPIAVQDIVEVLKEEDNLSDAAIFGLLSILGQGVSTFPSVDSPRRKDERR